MAEKCYMLFHGTDSQEMNMSPAKKYDLISEQEYLNGELLSEIRHEYIDGAIYALVGRTFNHARLVGNFARKIGNHLEGKSVKSLLKAPS